MHLFLLQKFMASLNEIINTYARTHTPTHPTHPPPTHTHIHGRNKSFTKERSFRRIWRGRLFQGRGPETEKKKTTNKPASQMKSFYTKKWAALGGWGIRRGSQRTRRHVDITWDRQVSGGRAYTTGCCLLIPMTSRYGLFA